MKTVIAGGTGFLGKELVRRLASRGEIVVLTRHSGSVMGARDVEWNPPQSGDWERELAEADVVINLAGENIGEGRWTAARKQRLLESRIAATDALVNALRKAPARDRLFLSASAIGYYGPRGDEPLDETAAPGSDFLSQLTRAWEASALAAEGTARVVILRIGVVVGPGGGALEKMLLPFKLFLGGPIGNGRQWMSWIALDDLGRMVEWAIDQPGVRGIYNATAPNPVTNRDFSRALGKELGRPSILPAPGFALRLLFGEMADAILLSGQKVLPRRSVGEGFRFEAEKLADALRRALGR